jgi:hypothetical protein
MEEKTSLPASLTNDTLNKEVIEQDEDGRRYHPHITLINGHEHHTRRYIDPPLNEETEILEDKNGRKYTLATKLVNGKDVKYRQYLGTEKTPKERKCRRSPEKDRERQRLYYYVNKQLNRQNREDKDLNAQFERVFMECWDTYAHTMVHKTKIEISFYLITKITERLSADLIADIQRHLLKYASGLLLVHATAAEANELTFENLQHYINTFHRTGNNNKEASATKDSRKHARSKKSSVTPSSSSTQQSNEQHSTSTEDPLIYLHGPLKRARRSHAPLLSFAFDIPVIMGDGTMCSDISSFFADNVGFSDLKPEIFLRNQ